MTLRQVMAILVVLGSMHSTVWASGKTAEQALRCRQMPACVYLGEAYQGDRALRAAMQAAFRGSQLTPPAWLGKGVTTPLVPLQVGREPYLRAMVCEPHNCPHQLLVLYAPRRQQLVARYTREDGSELWLGRPSAAQRALLLDENDPASPLAGKLTDSTPLPLVLP